MFYRRAQRCSTAEMFYRRDVLPQRCSTAEMFYRRDVLPEIFLYFSTWMKAGQVNVNWNIWPGIKCF
jgi:hypothetical protein